ncbi:hypothetical protein JW877_08200 [bacterium]|nr:hypothetical protein [bacterium]
MSTKFTVISFMLFIFWITCLFGQDITPISEIQIDPGSCGEVTVRGIVTIGAGILDDDQFKAYIQDSSGYGINIFDYDFTTEMFNNTRRGCYIEVQGSVYVYRGITEITPIMSLTLIDSNRALPAAESLSTSDANDARWEGTWIQVAGPISGISSSGAGYNVNINDGSGSTILRIWETTGIPESTFRIGNSYRVKGVGSIYISGNDTTWQILIGYPEDIVETDTSTTDTLTEYTPLSEIQQNPGAFSQVKVQGIVTIGPNLISETYYKVYIQDTSGYGILLFDYEPTSDMLAGSVRGNMLEVEGTVEEYSGTTEIKDFTSFTVLATGQVLPEAETLSTNGVNNPRWEGTLVYTEGRVTDAYTAGGGHNIYLNDGSGQTTIRIWETTDIPLETVEAGSYYGMYGVGSVYLSGEDTTFQITVCYLEDIIEIDTSITDTTLEITPISAIQQNPGDFDRVAVEGIVTIGANILDTSYFKAYIQDTSGYGINLFHFEGTPSMLNAGQRGNLVRVEGYVEEYGAVTEITDFIITMIDSNHGLPELDTITTSQVSDPRWEGTMVYLEAEITDAYFAGGGVNVKIDDGSGETVIRAWETTGISQSSFTMGEWYFFRGVGSVYIDYDDDTTYQLLLGYNEDFGLLGTAPIDTSSSGKIDLVVEPHPFAPSLGEEMPIIVDVPNRSEVIIRLFDITGRLVKTLLDDTFSGRHTENWDGKDDYARKLKPGIYICHLEVKELASGKTEKRIAPVTIGTTLK